MSVAYFIELDDEDPGFETFVNGKAVAHAIEDLDALCEREGMAKLDDFMGQSMDDVADMLGEDIEMPDDAESDSLWFEAQAGLDAIDALVGAIQKNPDALSDADAVLEDLAEYRAVLQQAAALGARWHLALDF
ncbi:MAG: hypothetical protein CFE44_12380 [Burkholderiales bacterium PBB4]|nr:MAG: hypothetical protein CFE44_12380 [Burkholderiales bacterium PBB4]